MQYNLVSQIRNLLQTWTKHTHKRCWNVCVCTCALVAKSSARVTFFYWNSVKHFIQKISFDRKLLYECELCMRETLLIYIYFFLFGHTLSETHTHTHSHSEVRCSLTSCSVWTQTDQYFRFFGEFLPLKAPISYVSYEMTQSFNITPPAALPPSLPLHPPSDGAVSLPCRAFFCRWVHSQ